MGIPVDFLDVEEVESGDLEYYKAAILTMPLTLDEAYYHRTMVMLENCVVLLVTLVL